MWTTSIITKNEAGIINTLTHKHQISFFGYPLHTETKDDHILVTFYGWTNASITKTEQFYKELITYEDVIKAEHHEQAIIICMKQPKEAIVLYNPQIIYLKPILAEPNFTQTYTVGSWNREDLSAVMQLRVPNVEVTLKRIKEEPITNIGLFSPVGLTTKQQAAFQLAQNEGYYQFPKRNTNLTALSKKAQISMATFQAHLRKAEQKILNTFSQLK